MKILHVLNGLQHGGLELMLQRVLPLLKDAGITSGVCCQAANDPNMETIFRNLGCDIHRIPKHAIPQVCAATAARIVKENGYDQVHSHLGYTSGGIALAAKRAGVPCIVSLHSSSPTSLWSWRDNFMLSSIRSWWLAYHRHLMDRYVDIFAGHSETNIVGYCSSWQENPKRYRVVHNGIFVPETLPDREAIRCRFGWTQRRPVLLHVANFRPVKNYGCLLDIAVLLVQECPKLLLVMVGGGRYRRVVEQMVDERGLQDHVHFAGLVDDPWQYYVAADALVFPSWTEGCGNVLLEGQAVGLPVIASDIPAHRESVAPQQREYLFPPEDASLGARMVLERMSKQSEPVAEAAKRYVREEYSVGGLAESFVRLYSECRRLG